MYRSRFNRAVRRTRVRVQSDIVTEIYRLLMSIFELRFVLSYCVIVVFLAYNPEQRLLKIARFFWGDKYDAHATYIRVKDYLHHALAIVVFLPIYFVVPNRLATFCTIFISLLILVLPLAEAYTYVVEAIFLVLLVKANGKRMQFMIIILISVVYGLGYLVHDSKTTSILGKNSTQPLTVLFKDIFKVT